MRHKRDRRVQFFLFALASFLGPRVLWLLSLGSWKVNMKQVGPWRQYIAEHDAITHSQGSPINNIMGLHHRSTGPWPCGTQLSSNDGLCIAQRFETILIIHFLLIRYTSYVYNGNCGSIG